MVDLRPAHQLYDANPVGRRFRGNVPVLRNRRRRLGAATFHHITASHRDRRIRTLPRDALISTGGTQHADWNYRPVVGSVLRRRHELVSSLLPVRCDRLLELGYGSGLMMPELARHCDELHGIDLHDKERDVAAALVRAGISAQLRIGTVTAMPYEDQFFDCVVAESLLAHVEALDLACNEVRRVLRPGGVFIAVVPTHARVVDSALKMLTGASAKKDFADRRAVVPALLRHFEVDAQRSVPRRGARILRLYTAFELRPRA
jgi:SAM-dependent methyltransferase